MTTDVHSAAFPALSHEVQCGNFGLSKREYFATHSDQPGMIEIAHEAGVRYMRGTIWANEKPLGHFDDWWDSLDNDYRMSLWAKVKIKQADALLKYLYNEDK